jgi:hypothetical protein
MMGWLDIPSLLVKRFSGDKRGAVRAANVADQVDKLVKRLIENETNLEILANRDKPDRKKIEKALTEHKKLVGKIAPLLKQIIEFEFSSYQNDTSEPLRIIQNFMKVLTQHRKNAPDEEFKETVGQVIRRVSKDYSNLLLDVRKKVAEVTEVFSREIVGARSAYSVSVGDLGKMALLIEDRELQQRDFDSKINGILKGLDTGIKKIDNYLKNRGKNNAIGSSSFERAFLNENAWVKVGEQEFRRAKNGRWMGRKIGMKGAGGFVKKDELAELGILHLELNQAITLFYQHFKTLIDYLGERSEMSKEVIGHAGYMEHKISHSLEKVRGDMKTYLAGNKEMLIALQLAEREEKKAVTKAERTHVSQGQHTVIQTRAASKRADAAIAAGLAGVMLAGGVFGADVPVKNAQAEGQNGKAAAVRDIHNVKAVQDEVRRKVLNRISKKVTITRQFNQGVSDVAIGEAPDIHDLFPELYTELQEAAANNDFKVCKDLVNATGFKIIVGDAAAEASVEGTEWLNLGISKERAKYRNKIGTWANAAGIPVEFKGKEVARGETGQAELVAKVKRILEKDPKKADPVIDEIRNHLGPKGQEVLKYWYARLVKPPGKGSKRKAKIKKEALAQILYLTNKIGSMDAFILAPHRKVIIEITLEYDREGEAPQTIVRFVTADPDVTISPIDDAHLLGEKAALNTIPTLPKPGFRKEVYPNKNWDRGRKNPISRKSIPRGESKGSYGGPKRVKT